ncbi:MAG: potassium channel protein [Phenylobacterium sp.]|nr:potassium channel protein [Phenylobacterium sp.]
MNRTVSGLLASPLRNLAAVVGFVLAMMAIATAGYMLNGWSLSDAFYMVVLTLYSVGYQEVRPIDTPALHVLTVTTIIFGCTAMILLTGVLVQVFTVGQIRELLGMNSVAAEVEKLNGHVIICGFGRIGVMLAKDLKDGRVGLVVLERDEARAARARAEGYLVLEVDAADEASLRAAGIGQARVLATVVPDDAANVFITLTARSLNRDLQIIARGEMPSTESKLLYAGADKVVLPTHIGAERMAEMILYPETARFIRGSDRMRDFDQTLRDLGLRMEVVTVTENAGAIGQTLADMERKAKGGFFVVQLDRKNGDILTRPPGEAKIELGDGVLIVTKTEAAAIRAMFQAPAERVRVGRSVV